MGNKGNSNNMCNKGNEDYKSNKGNKGKKVTWVARVTDLEVS